MLLHRLRLAAVVPFLLCACSSDPEDPETRIRSRIAVLEQASREKDLGTLKDAVSESYRDGSGRTAEDIRSTAIRSVDGEVIAFPPQALALTAGVGVQLRRNDGEVAFRNIDATLPACAAAND